MIILLFLTFGNLLDFKLRKSFNLSTDAEQGNIPGILSSAMVWDAWVCQINMKYWHVICLLHAGTGGD